MYQHNWALPLKDHEIEKCIKYQTCTTVTRIFTKHTHTTMIDIILSRSTGVHSWFLIFSSRPVVTVIMIISSVVSTSAQPAVWTLGNVTQHLIPHHQPIIQSMLTSLFHIVLQCNWPSALIDSVSPPPSMWNGTMLDGMV